MDGAPNHHCSEVCHRRGRHLAAFLSRPPGRNTRPAATSGCHLPIPAAFSKPTVMLITTDRNLFSEGADEKTVALQQRNEARARNLTLARAAKKNPLKTQSGLPEEASEKSPGRLKAIRLRCQGCVEDPIVGVRDCAIPECPLWGFRFGHRPSAASNKGRDVGDAGNNAQKAVKLYCLWCSGGSAHERSLCPATDCVLWRFRLGAPCKTQQ